MKNVVLKIPSLAFVVLLMGSVFLAFQFRKDETVYIFDSCIITIALITWFWTVSVADYMSHEAKNKTYLPWIYGLKSLEIFLYLFGNLSFFKDTVLADLVVFPFILVFPLINAFLLSRLIKKILYARSWYFVFIEISIPVVGMMTLTPDIQAWEKSDKT